MIEGTKCLGSTSLAGTACWEGLSKSIIADGWTSNDDNCSNACQQPRNQHHNSTANCSIQRRGHDDVL
jgi:hypothetical protein